MDLHSFDVPEPPIPTHAAAASLDRNGMHDNWNARGRGRTVETLPFSLRSPGTAVLGTLGGGVDALIFAPNVVITELRVVGARCTEAQLTSLGTRRTLQRAEAWLEERIHAPAEPGLAWIEWTARDALTFEVTWLLPHGVSEAGGAVHIRNSGRALAWHPPASSDIAWCAAAPAPRFLLADPEGADIRCHATFRLAAGATVRMTFGLARAGDRTALQLDPGHHHNARSARYRRADRELLAIQSPDAELDAAAVRASRAAAELPLTVPGIGRIAAVAVGALDHHGRIDCGDATVLALAALALGDIDAATHTLHAMDALQLPTGAIPETVSLHGQPGTASLRATALFVMLAARHFLTAGSHADADAGWPAVAAALDFLQHVAGNDDPLRTAAHADARVLAEAIRAPGTVAAGAAPVTLIGTGTAQAPAMHPIQTVLAAHALTPPFAALRDAARVLRFTALALGVEPDAPRHRLTLAPAFPHAWRHCRIERIRVADSTISFAFQFAGSHYRFAITQESGAVPLRLVFEPRITGRTLAGATINGEPAQLDARTNGASLIVPVQLVLDQPHVLEFTTSAGE
jgi:hypothetical protein